MKRKKCFHYWLGSCFLYASVLFKFEKMLVTIVLTKKPVVVDDNVNNQVRELKKCSFTRGVFVIIMGSRDLMI